MTRLALASLVALFLELAVIRWAGAHVLYLAYVANFLLLASFLGLGLGCFVAERIGPDRARALVVPAPWLLLVLVGTVTVSEFEVVLSGAQVVYFGAERGRVALPAWIALPGLGVLVVVLFASLGAAVGSELARARRLVAYSVDIAGSLAGVFLFGVVAFARLPATLWFAVAGAVMLCLLPARRRVIYASAAVVVLVVGVVAWADAGSLWSPYYRVSLVNRGLPPPRGPEDASAASPVLELRVNSVTHQVIADFRRREPFYEVPYRALGLHVPGAPPGVYFVDTYPRAAPRPDGVIPIPGRDVAPGEARWNGRVLVVGAGIGTDVAFALAYGARSVDAVEIDPLIADLGRARHPNRPYADPRVRVHVEDARSFLERTRDRYDLILFALPDSLTLASPYAGLRLESFLYTVEGLRLAVDRLDPRTGLLAVYNYFREMWLVDRLAATFERAAGRAPRVYTGDYRGLPAVYLAGPAAARVPEDLAADWRLTPRRPRGGEALVPTDDWPFLYLRQRVVPVHLALAMGAMIVFAAFATWLALRLTRGRAVLPDTAPRASARGLVPFFLMGAAFLLLETAGIVRMAQLFGSTWFVNALVFFAVLAMVLVANGIAHRFALRRTTVLVVALFAALGIAWTLPPSALASFSPAARYAAATLLLFVPILLANLVFSRTFRDSARPAGAFAANLLGAVVGGALEYSSLVVGYRGLFLIAAALYAAAGVTSRRAA